MTIIVPFTAGGPADTAARTFAEVLRHHLGQSLIAENRPAASGITGTEAVALGEPDGYTLLLGGIAALVLVPPVQKVRYDVEKDFAPLGLIWRSPQVFAVRPGLGVNTVAEFVAYAKAHAASKVTDRIGRHRNSDASRRRTAPARERHRAVACAVSQHGEFADRSGRRPHRCDLRRRCDPAASR